MQICVIGFANFTKMKMHNFVTLKNFFKKSDVVRVNMNF